MLFIIFAFGALIVSTAAQTCANEQSPCFKTQTANNIDVYLCPEGMACLQNTTCCEYADIQVSTTTTTTVASPTPTPTSTCVDKLNPSTGVSDCPKNAGLCNNSVYYQLMTEQCPKTCNRCSNNNNNNNNNGGSSSSCVDKVNPSTGVSECAAKAYLCTNTVYVSLMKDQCPKTCGFC
uniref:ShKT domain-containing protein n=1 Tax=Caenorhabditis japonica TaxID=281687 RepID=A0A8R1I0B6_CAEJA